MKYQTSAVEHEGQHFCIMSFQSLVDCTCLCVRVCAL